MGTFTNSEDPDEMRIMQHFIRANTVCIGKKDLQNTLNISKKYIYSDIPRYIQWTIPSSLYQTSIRTH